MQSRNQIIDDLAKLMTNAFGLAQNATGEIENAVKSLLDRYLADKGLVTREEFDVMKEIHSELQKEILDLKKEIEIGNFREDLFHRINVFEINIEPLNQRISDIPLLIKYFSKKISENYNLTELNIDENDSYILNYNWKGNVRELRNLIERIAILQPENKEKVSNIVKESLKNENFNEKITENSLSVPLKEAREKFEKEYLTIQLKKFNGNISKTASFVGMERSALHRKLKGLGIKEFN